MTSGEQRARKMRQDANEASEKRRKAALTTINNNVNITIKESKDPKATAEAIKTEFNKEMTRGTENLKTNVDQ